jgi:hypothetical protein
MTGIPALDPADVFAGIRYDNAARGVWVDTAGGRVRAEIGNAVKVGDEGLHQVIKRSGRA